MGASIFYEVRGLDVLMEIGKGLELKIKIAASSIMGVEGHWIRV